MPPGSIGTLALLQALGEHLLRRGSEVLLPRRWVVERSNAWAARFRRLARDDERLAATLAGLHVVAFAILMLKRFVEFIVSSA